MNAPVTIYTASFIWEPGEYDAEFHRLNAIIGEVAQAMPDYLGAESWHAAEGRRGCVVYYWRDLQALQTFARHPAHQQAKREYRRWYRGYHIVIGQVLRAYGDGALPHLVPDERAGRR